MMWLSAFGDYAAPLDGFHALVLDRTSRTFLNVDEWTSSVFSRQPQIPKIKINMMEVRGRSVTLLALVAVSSVVATNPAYTAYHNNYRQLHNATLFSYDATVSPPNPRPVQLNC